MTYKLDNFFKPGTIEVDWGFAETLWEILKLHGAGHNLEYHTEGDVYVHTEAVVRTMTNILGGVIETHGVTVPEEFKPERILDRHQPYIHGGGEDGESADLRGLKIQRILVCAALLHDIGKPEVFRVGKDGRLHSYGHEYTGEAMVRRLLWDEEIPVREAVCALVRWHMEPCRLLDHRDPWTHFKKVEEELRKFSTVMPGSNVMINWYDLALLKWCDVSGAEPAWNGIRAHDYSVLRYVVSRFCAGQTLYTRDSGFGYMRFKTFLPDYRHKVAPKVCVMMMGLPGAGKNTFIESDSGLKTVLRKTFENAAVEQYGDLPAEQLEPNLNKMTVLSRDTIREELGLCKPGEKYLGTPEEEATVTEVFVKKLETAAAESDVLVFNNINNKREYRDSYKKLLGKYRCFWVYVYVQAETLALNVERRKDSIPEHSFTGIINNFEMPEADEYNVLCVSLNG